VPRSELYKKDDNKAKQAPGDKNKKPAQPAKPVKGKKPTDKKGEGNEDELLQDKIYAEWPKSEAATMIELKNFLKHLESDRLTNIELGRKEKPRVREPEEFSRIQEEGYLSIEDSLSHLMKFNLTRQDLKVMRQAKMDSIITQIEQEKSEQKSNFSKIRQEFDTIDALIQEACEKDNLVFEKIKGIEEEPLTL
jgi:hypothetical protein